MARHRTEAIRNLALVGPQGAGKTTLAEALLHAAGAVGEPGSVERGTTVCDFDPLEREHGHSLCSAVAGFEHAGVHVNLIDTPGAPDLLGQTLPALAAVETAVLVLDAAGRGVPSHARRLMGFAAGRRLCRFVVINRIDADGADPEGMLAAVREAFGRECLPLNLPADGGGTVADCFFAPGGEPDFSSVEAAHTALVDQVVEVDERLMELYLEQGERLDPEQLHAPFEQALREGHLVPVCFASGRTGAGVPELLEIIARLAPNPLEGNPPVFLNGEGPDAGRVEAVPDPARHVLAHVFKVRFDPYLGRVAVFRLYQGTVRRGAQLFVGDGRKPIRAAHLLGLRGAHHEELEAAVPGDICALAKVEALVHGAVLHDSHEEDHYRLEPLRFPTPVFGLAVVPRSRGDEQKVSEALARLVAEDPCLALEHDGEGRELVLRGLGALHLRLALERLARQYRVDVETRPPRVPYRETVTVAAEGHHRHKKQTGGAGQFGEVFLRVEPLPRGAGFEFVDAVTGGAIPSSLIPAVEKGVRQAMAEGCVAGFPMQDVRVTVHDGKTHPVDSKEIAFVIAGRKAFLDAAAKARPIVLEPVMRLEVEAPAAAMGDVTGDLAARRARITRSDTRADGKVRIEAEAPLAELGDYESRLRALTGGEGSYTLELAGYEPVPPQIQQRLRAARKTDAS